MAQFIIETSDAVYTYNVEESTECDTAQQSFTIQNNAKFSDTQGFLRKKQVGDKRIGAKVILSDSKARIEENIFPMIDYPDSVSCTFERNIPLRNTTTATMVLENVRILQEFNNADDYEIELTLIEVIKI